MPDPNEWLDHDAERLLDAVLPTAPAPARTRTQRLKAMAWKVITFPFLWGLYAGGRVVLSLLDLLPSSGGKK